MSAWVLACLRECVLRHKQTINRETIRIVAQEYDGEHKAVRTEHQIQHEVHAVGGSLDPGAVLAAGC